jgi:hypothetical protein
MIKQRCVGKRRAVDGQRCGAGDNGRNLIIAGLLWRMTFLGLRFFVFFIFFGFFCLPFTFVLVG